MKSRMSVWGRHFAMAIAVFCLLTAPAAQAKVNISSCTLTSPPGMVINTNLTSNLSSTTSFLLSCATNGNGASAIVTIKLNLGNHLSAGTRNLVSGANQLSYQLFQDAGFSNPWNETTNIRSVSISGDTSNLPITIYGKLDGSGVNLDQPVGTYIDAIQVTIGW